MELLIIAGVDITHLRLVDLTRLADRAKPFYDWVEQQSQQLTNRKSTLDVLLRELSPDDIYKVIEYCYRSESPNLPVLFDGVGRSYPHSKACYYFFSWLIRDAPQQRLSPLIQRIIKNSGKSRLEVEIEVLTALLCRYRSDVKTFTWDAIREIVIDRLEGSRRSIKGHEKEAVVRLALIIAVQHYFEQHKNYGIYQKIEIPAGQVSVNNETYDISVNLFDDLAQMVRKILVPIKTRETEGGGHSHLFSRDVLSAIHTARAGRPEDFVMLVIVARYWAVREAENLRKMVDHQVVFDLSPEEFHSFGEKEQAELDEFIAAVLQGLILPKSAEV